MDFRLSAQEQRMRLELRQWLDDTLPLRREAPRDPADKIALSRLWQRQLFDGGWAGISWPVAYGGRGADTVQQLIFNEECIRAGAPDSLNLSVALGLVGPTLIHCGTEEQRERFLPRILRGEDIWCQGFSEPNAGSDLASLSMRGVVRGDAIAVTGQKIWTSFAQHADWCILVVRTNPEARRHDGLTFLLVDLRSPGITIRPLVEITGEAWFNEVFFDDVAVPLENVVGAVDRGWDVVITTLMHERGGTAPHARLRQEHEALVRWVVSKGRRGDPIIRQRLAKQATEVSIARLNAYRNACEIVRTGQPGAEGSILKLYWSELEQRIMDDAFEILGAPAVLLAGDPAAAAGGFWARELLWSRAATIYAGTSEVQRNIIAQRVLGLPR
jgi:alkylation response protein AidB-like acyl-CoA dehydrogenase